jgi:glycosyltransferase involved in cell wall biosynthesis
MKLAVVDHVGNFGGGSRVLRGLLHGLVAARPDLEMTYFCNAESLRREAMREELGNLEIEVAPLASVRLGASGIAGIPGSATVLRAIQDRIPDGLGLLPPLISGAVSREIERRVRGFDVAFFPWPYQLACPRLDCPSVATFHDFNFKYFFGSHTYGARQLAQLEAQMPGWLAAAVPVVSTDFMAAELTKFYPQAAGRVKVVRLAPPSIVGRIDREAALKLVEALGVRLPYALYPTNTCAHKNIGTLVAAIALLRDSGVRLPLVLTGPDTASATGRASVTGVERGAGAPDVIGLGYVSNDQMDALIQCAAVVVSASLYEAGNGPGLDAWGRGVPVAMSNIAAFMEHIEVQGVRAFVFDPRDPGDIAAKLREVLDNPDRARVDAELSRRALENLSWAGCAAQYLQVFDQAAGG